MLAKEDIKGVSSPRDPLLPSDKVFNLLKTASFYLLRYLDP